MLERKRIFDLGYAAYRNATFRRFSLSAMDFDKPQYNDEFLRKGGPDYQRAEQDFGPLMFALHHESAFKKFEALNRKAISSKRWMQNAGIISIVLGLFALLLAALEMALIAPAVEMANCADCDPPVWVKSVSKTAAEVLVKTIAMIAAVFGVISFITGFFGGGVGARKRRWLLTRASCELFRQWRWNYYLAYADQIIDAIDEPERQENYRAQMDAAAERFFLDCQLELASVMSGNLTDEQKYGTLESLVDVPQGPPPAAPSDTEREKKLAMFLDAFDAIRIRSQLWYTHYLLQPEGSLRTHPVRQTAVLHRAEEILIVLVLVLHSLIVCGVVFDIPEIKSPAVHFLAIASALTTLAIMCIERGLRCADQIARLKFYFNEMSGIRTRFRAAKQGAKQLPIAREVGDAALEELREFIREGNRARFVI